MTKEEFIEKIKELGFKKVEIVIKESDNELFFQNYNDNLQIKCRTWINDVSLYFCANNIEYMTATGVTYEFALFLIKKIENGFNNNI